MNMQEVVKSTGEVSIKIFDAAGKLKEKIFLIRVIYQVTINRLILVIYKLLKKWDDN